MATRFGSAVQRNFWAGIIYAVITDWVLAVIVSWAFGNEGGQLFLIATLIVAAAYIFQLVYGLISSARAAALFFLFEKEARISALVNEMVIADLPPPRDFYAEPLEYLSEVAQSREAGDKAKLFAGATLGGIETLRATNRGFLTISSLIVLEAAIARYSQRFDRN